MKQNFIRALLGIGLILAFMIVANSCKASEELSLRLTPVFYDDRSESVYVSVDLKYEGHERFYLADQNYRLYYDSELLSLNKKRSRSELPKDRYSKISFNEVFEDLKAGYINELSFDDQLGFLNFNIDLKDVHGGGILLNNKDEWKRVAILNFKVHNKTAMSNIVWSASGRTDSYATAFVEIMEWVGPNHTEPIQVQEFIDAEFNVAESIRVLDMSIAPNPAIDFVNIEFEKPIDETVLIAITDLLGRQVSKKHLKAGESGIKLDIEHLSPGTYNLEIFEKDLIISTKKAAFIKITP